MAAGRLWVLSGLLGRWEQHNYKFGGPRGGWWVGRGAQQRGWAQVAHGAEHPSQVAGADGCRRAPWERGRVVLPACLPPPNHALEPTAPRAAWCSKHISRGAAAHRERWTNRTVRGWCTKVL